MLFSIFAYHLMLLMEDIKQTSWVWLKIHSLLASHQPQLILILGFWTTIWTPQFSSDANLDYEWKRVEWRKHLGPRVVQTSLIKHALGGGFTNLFHPENLGKMNPILTIISFKGVGSTGVFFLESWGCFIFIFRNGGTHRAGEIWNSTFQFSSFMGRDTPKR